VVICIFLVVVVVVVIIIVCVGIATVRCLSRLVLSLINYSSSKGRKKSVGLDLNHEKVRNFSSRRRTDVESHDVRGLIQQSMLHR
jgi:hypothetical protein